MANKRFFELDAKQMEQINAWCEEQDAIVYQQQLNGKDKTIKDMAKMFGGAYYGAIGGQLTYSFSPNSIGVSATVKHSGTGATLDVSDYDNW